MRMRDVLWQIWLNCGYFLTVAASGFFLYKLCAPFVRPRNGRFWRVLLFLTLAGSTGMVIWIGDPNLLYTLPAFFALFLLSTRGDRIGRVAVCIILFCLEMSVCALLDTYVERINRNALYDVLVRLARPLVFGPLWLLLRRRLPREPVVLSRRLWKLVLGLAAMPLCALIAVVLLTFRRYDSIEVNTVAMYQGMVVLPFVFLTSLVLLFAILILADHERLEQANRLAGLREVYYQGLRQQETQVRRLRHDLRNHLTAVRGFLEQGDEQGAIGYLDQIAGSPALRGTRRLCENEAANAVLTAKAEAMEREGVAADFAVSLPRDLPVADMDLCALLATLWTTPSRAAGVPGNGESPSAARRTRDSSCCGWRTPWAARCSRILQLPRRTRPPTASASPGCGKSQSATAAPWTPGSGTTGSSWWCACPWQGRPKHCKSPCADGRRRHRRELDFPYLRCICTEKQGGRPMDGLPVPQPKRTQSIFKSSICSPEGPVKNQFSNPPKVLGITHFSAVWKVSTPAARRSAAAWSTSST